MLSAGINFIDHAGLNGILSIVSIGLSVYVKKLEELGYQIKIL